MSSVKIFSGSGSIELAKKIASEFGKPLGKGKLGKFSDGELSFRYTETVRGSDVYIVQSTVDSSDNIMELFLMIRRPPRSTPKPSSAASDVYKRQAHGVTGNTSGFGPEESRFEP